MKFHLVLYIPAVRVSLTSGMYHVLPYLPHSLYEGGSVSWAWLESDSHSVVSDSLRPQGLYSPWNPPGQNTGMGRRSLLQGIFPT